MAPESNQFRIALSADPFFLLTVIAFRTPNKAELHFS